MLYVLTEEEFKRMVPKDQVVGPVREFLETLKSVGTVKDKAVTVTAEQWTAAFKALRTKLGQEG